MHFYQNFNKDHRKLYQFGSRVLIGFASIAVMALPAKAAEKVYFSYGIFERSISVSSLEAYAQDGTVNSDLAFFNSLKMDN